MSSKNIKIFKDEAIYTLEEVLDILKISRRTFLQFEKESDVLVPILLSKRTRRYAGHNLNEALKDRCSREQE